MDKQKLGGEKICLQKSEARLSLVQGLSQKTHPLQYPPISKFLFSLYPVMCSSALRRWLEG